MCEILVCVKDRGTSGILAKDSRAPKQGDVVVLAPNGWGWGLAELGQVIEGNPNGNHNFFRIFKLPNVDPTALQAQKMLSPELDVDPLDPSPYLQFRAFFFDKAKIPTQALRDHWNDDTRAAPFITLPYTAAQLSSIVSGRPAIPFVSKTIGQVTNGNG